MKVSICAATLFAIFATAFVLFFSAETFAQESDAELRATIRAAIMSDPRTSDLTEAEIEGMVDALVGEAEAQGVTSQDIVWRPEEPAPAPVPPSCGSMPALLCALNEALGFDGSDVKIPIGLGITSALLLFVIGSMLLHHHGHHPVAGEIGKPAIPPGMTPSPVTPPSFMPPQPPAS